VALSGGYVARETAGNLRRNIILTTAAILTMFVALSALGGVLIMRQAISKAAIQWKGGVQLAIFLNPTVTTTESQAIGHELQTTPGVKSFRYVDKPQAYQEFRTIFGGNNDIVSALGPNDMPPSYRVVPDRTQDISQLGKAFEGQPGVLNVAYAKQEIDALQSQFHTLRIIGLFLALGVMVGAVALIVITIQLGIFARRREVAVMKLVGATNWFIRIPFMLEGLIQGVVGSILAFVLIFEARNVIARFVGNETILGTNRLYVSPHEAVFTGILILVVGIVVGMLGSAFAVRRFLAV
jgi:cell division transport system permease protein